MFDGPEITVPKDTIHAGGWENRDLHNINGMMFVGLNALPISAPLTHVPAAQSYISSTYCPRDSIKTAICAFP